MRIGPNSIISGENKFGNGRVPEFVRSHPGLAVQDAAQLETEIVFLRRQLNVLRRGVCVGVRRRSRRQSLIARFDLIGSATRLLAEAKRGFPGWKPYHSRGQAMRLLDLGVTPVVGGPFPTRPTVATEPM